MATGHARSTRSSWILKIEQVLCADPLAEQPSTRASDQNHDPASRLHLAPANPVEVLTADNYRQPMKASAGALAGRFPSASFACRGKFTLIFAVAMYNPMPPRKRKAPEAVAFGAAVREHRTAK